MIKDVIDYINGLIEVLGFSNLHGITEQIHRGEKIFPAVYCSSGEYSPENLDFDFTNATVYHRLNGEATTDQEESVTDGCNVDLTVTYPMRMVMVFDRTLLGDDGYGGDRMMQNMRSIIPSNNIASLRTSLKIRAVQVALSNFSWDSFAVWEEEFDGIDFRVPSTHLMMKIEYDVTLIGREDCFEAVDCDDAAFDVEGAIQDKYCDPVTVSNSDDTYLVSTSVDLELPDINHIDSDSSVVPTPAQTVFTATPCADATVENSTQSYQVTVASGATLVLPDIIHIDSDGLPAAATPAQTVFTATPCVNSIDLILSFEAGQTVIDFTVVAGDEEGTYTTETLTNIDSVVYKINAVVDTLPFTLSAGDTFEATIVQTAPASDSKIKLEGTY